MIIEFLISRTDGRCLYYLSDEYHYDPQLISGYLASLIMFMKSHQNNVPKTIILDKGLWVLEQDESEIYFIAASIDTNDPKEEDTVRNLLNEILESVIIITGNKVIPIESDEDEIQKIIDETIKSKLLSILTIEEAFKFQPGILHSYILH